MYKRLAIFDFLSKGGGMFNIGGGIVALVICFLLLSWKGSGDGIRSFMGGVYTKRIGGRVMICVDMCLNMKN